MWISIVSASRQPTRNPKPEKRNPKPETLHEQVWNAAASQRGESGDDGRGAVWRVSLHDMKLDTLSAAGRVAKFVDHVDGSAELTFQARGRDREPGRWGGRRQAGRQGGRGKVRRKGGGYG